MNNLILTIGYPSLTSTVLTTQVGLIEYTSPNEDRRDIYLSTDTIHFLNNQI